MEADPLNYQTLALKGVAVSIRIGAHPSEKLGPQRVEVDVALSRRHDGYRNEGLDACMDYSRIHRYLTEEWPERGHQDLLESWAEDLIGFCMMDPKVETCRVAIRKPDIYPGNAFPEIDVMRQR